MIFKTTDLVIASTLRAYGVPLERIEHEGFKGSFVFDLTDEDQQIIAEFDCGKASVEPMIFLALRAQLLTAVSRR